MNSVYLGSATRPNGYFGDRATVHLVFCSGYLLEVHRHGFHKSPVLPCQFIDHEEAAAYITFSPDARQFYKQFKPQ